MTSIYKLSKPVSYIVLVCLCLLLLIDITPASAAPVGDVLYAAPGGLTSGACDTWAHACTLVYALGSVAGYGDMIWVKQGIHTPGTSRSDTFQLVSGVAIYGGFFGTETERSQRDPDTYFTFLSGDIDGDDTQNPIIDLATVENNYNNSYHVVTGSGADDHALLDGVVITGGYATGATTASGGGMYNDAGSPDVRDVIFTGNWAPLQGGGMYNVNGSSPELRDVIFYNNGAGFDGGAMCNNASDPDLINVTFKANAADRGGGIYSINATSGMTLTNVTFYDNHADQFGGGMFNSSSSPILLNVTISNNSADLRGGGIDNSNPGTSLTLENVIMWDNSAPDGPELYFYNSAVATITDSVVEGGCPSSGTCTNVIDADPVLSPPTDNGGETPTMALGPGSSAINAGGINAPCATTDQRGVTRPQGPKCDIGAYERELTGTTLGDYDGDGTTDIAIRRGGKWYIMGVGNYGWGIPTDIPVPGDYNGDGAVEIAVFRDGKWFIKDIGTINYGIPGDIPVPADYDGDGTTDIAIRRGGKFYIMGIGNFGWGLASDIPVPADYDGDGAAEIAVYRDGKWFIMGIGTINYGIAGDIPVPADYDGDGTTEIAIRRGGKFYIMGIGNYGWGLASDVPVPSDYNGDGAAEIAVFRDGKWFIMGMGSFNYGIAGDYPLPAPDTNADGDPYQ